MSDLAALSLPVTHQALQGPFLCGDEESYEAAKHRVEATYEERRTEIEQRQQAVIRRIAEEGLRG